jgi:plastocyanin
MKTTITSIFALIVSAFAIGQTNYTVVAQGTSWNSNDLFIEVGDSVTWINNNGGVHNVNGTTTTFPSNPESFGMLTTGQTWTYGHRFNIPGVYNYRCDVHSSMMIGTVTVDDGLGLHMNKASNFVISPNPASDKLSISADSNDFTVKIFDMMGGEILSKRMVNDYVLDVSLLQSGFYFIQVSSENGIQQQRLEKI